MSLRWPRLAICVMHPLRRSVVRPSVCPVCHTSENRTLTLHARPIRTQSYVKLLSRGQNRRGQRMFRTESTRAERTCLDCISLSETIVSRGNDMPTYGGKCKPPTCAVSSTGPDSTSTIGWSSDADRNVNYDGAAAEASDRRADGDGGGAMAIWTNL